MKEGQAEAYYSYFRGRYRDWPSLSSHYNTVLTTLKGEQVPLTLQSIDNALLDLLDILNIPAQPRDGDKRLFLLNRTTVRSFYNVCQEFPFLLPLLEKDSFTFVLLQMNGIEQLLVQRFFDNEVIKGEENVS